MGLQRKQIPKREAAIEVVLSIAVCCRPGMGRRYLGIDQKTVGASYLKTLHSKLQRDFFVQNVLSHIPVHAYQGPVLESFICSKPVVNLHLFFEIIPKIPWGGANGARLAQPLVCV